MALLVFLIFLLKQLLGGVFRKFYREVQLQKSPLLTNSLSKQFIISVKSWPNHALFPWKVLAYFRSSILWKTILNSIIPWRNSSFPKICPSYSNRFAWTNLHRMILIFFFKPTEERVGSSGQISTSFLRFCIITSSAEVV